MEPIKPLTKVLFVLASICVGIAQFGSIRDAGMSISVSYFALVAISVGHYILLIFLMTLGMKIDASLTHYRNVERRKKRREHLKETTGLSDDQLDDIEADLENKFGSPLGKWLSSKSK